MKNLMKWDTAFLSHENVTVEVDLISLTWKSYKRKYDQPIVLDVCNDKSHNKDKQSKIYDSMQNTRTCEFGERKITSLTVIPSWYCSAKCSYCYAAAEKKNKTVLTEKTVAEFIDRFNIVPEDIKGGMFLGGDPLENLGILKHIIDLFPNTDWTICTAFPVADEVIEDLLKFLMFKPNVEISLSIDPPNSLRYKASSENGKRERNIKWFNRFYKFLGSRIRVKTTINRDAFDIHELRTELPNNSRINFDGVAYGFEDIRLSDENTIDNIWKLYGKELELFLEGKVSERTSFMMNVFPMLHDEGIVKSMRTCGCGYNYFTLLPDGSLSYCDSPNKPILDENLYNEDMVADVVEATGECKKCEYLKLCGGSCGIKRFKELYCYVKVIDYVFSLYATFFITRKGVINDTQE